MRERQQPPLVVATPSPAVAAVALPRVEDEYDTKEFNLTTAAKELKVHRATAKHLILADGRCMRFSCGDRQQILMGQMKSKRKATRARMTYKITGADIKRIKLQLRGLLQPVEQP